MDFNFLKFIVTIKLMRNIADSYFLFGLKSDFESAFRLAVDCRRSSCDGCPRCDSCPFRQTFSQSITSDPLAVKRYQKPPYPFMFDFPILTQTPNRGGILEFGVTLVGSAINNFRYYLAAFVLLTRQNMTNKPAFASILKVESSDYRGNRNLVMGENGEIYPDRLFLFSAVELQKTCELQPDTVAISIETPLRLLQEGRPLRELSFSPFIRSLFRRISSLAYYYGGGEMELDYKWLSNRSTIIENRCSDFHWVDWNGHPGSGRLSGIVGKGVFNGDLLDFYPFLLLGQYFHVGKGASFGLGKYRLEKVTVSDGGIKNR